MEGAHFPQVHFPTLHPANPFGRTGLEGTAYLTRLRHTPITPYYYHEHSNQPILIGHTGADENRIITISTLTDHQGIEYTVAGTHFTWTPDGYPNAAQWDDFYRLLSITQQFPSLILTATSTHPAADLCLLHSLPAIKTIFPQLLTRHLIRATSANQKLNILLTAYLPPPTILYILCVSLTV